jgi:hypothetical protein
MAKRRGLHEGLQTRIDVVLMNVIDRGASPTRRTATSLQLLNLATAVFVLAWLAVACYAIAYLVSH